MARRVIPGRKDDAEKPRYDLIPPRALDEVVRALTHGTRYDTDPDTQNWPHVPHARRRYFSAVMRHLWAWWRGELRDPDSGLHHVAMAAASCLFLIGFDLGDADAIARQRCDAPPHLRPLASSLTPHDLGEEARRDTA